MLRKKHERNVKADEIKAKKSKLVQFLLKDNDVFQNFITSILFPIATCGSVVSSDSLLAFTKKIKFIFIPIKNLALAILV